MIFRRCPPTIIIGGLRSIILGVINSFWYILRLWRFAFQIETFLCINQAAGACDKESWWEIVSNMAKMTIVEIEATTPDVCTSTRITIYSSTRIYKPVCIYGSNAMAYICSSNWNLCYTRRKHAVLIQSYKKSCKNVHCMFLVAYFPIIIKPSCNML